MKKTKAGRIRMQRIEPVHERKTRSEIATSRHSFFDEFIASLSMEEIAERKIIIANAIEKTDSLIKATAEYREAIAKAVPDPLQNPILNFPYETQLEWLHLYEEKLKAHGIDELLRKTE